MAAGFLPYNILFISNHCTIYAVLDTDLLFNGVYNHPMDQSNRGLLSDNLKQCEKYMDLLSNYFQTHNIEECVKKLSEDLEKKFFSLTEGIMKYNILDKEFTNFMLSTEKKCNRQAQGYA
eukprot:1922209-Ditylum_brightwellii.AAC.1